MHHDGARGVLQERQAACPVDEQRHERARARARAGACRRVLACRTLPLGRVAQARRGRRARCRAAALRRRIGPPLRGCPSSVKGRGSKVGRGGVLRGCARCGGAGAPPRFRGARGRSVPRGRRTAAKARAAARRTAPSGAGRREGAAAAGAAGNPTRQAAPTAPRRSRNSSSRDIPRRCAPRSG